MVETSKPEEELKPAFDLIGTVSETFITVLIKKFNLDFWIMGT